GAALAKSGAGRLSIKSLRGGALNITGGTAELLAGRSTSVTSNVAALTIGTGAALDVNDQDVVIDYTDQSPFATIRSYIAAGYANGSWSGKGILSSAAAGSSSAANRAAIGYAEASSLNTQFPATFSGQSVDSTSVLLRYT